MAKNQKPSKKVSKKQMPMSKKNMPMKKGMKDTDRDGK